MIQRPVEQISKEDIESLISAKVGEKRTLDYKQQLPGGSDSEKREFLYDVSSFANALGGDLIFGITDERDADGKPTGLPASANGVAVSNLSNEIVRLENLIRDGVERRIQGIQWKTVDGFSAGPVLVMRIPKSLLAPHMVVFGGMARFYSRNSTGKYPMDLEEIRSAFVESATVGEKLRGFLADRLAKIAQGDLPLHLVADAKVVLHLVPLFSLGSAMSRDVIREAARVGGLLQPIKGDAWGGRYNFDGYVVVSAKGESYVQVFRSGLIEAAALPFLNIPEQYRNQIPAVDFERSILSKLALYLDAQNCLRTPLPIFAAISLLNVRNHTLLRGYGIDRENLQLPEILIEDYSADIARLLRPSFDALWQACGHEKSPNYDDEGNWRPGV